MNNLYWYWRQVYEKNTRIGSDVITGFEEWLEARCRCHVQNGADRLVAAAARHHVCAWIDARQIVQEFEKADRRAQETDAWSRPRRRPAPRQVAPRIPAKPDPNCVGAVGRQHSVQHLEMRRECASRNLFQNKWPLWKSKITKTVIRLSERNREGVRQGNTHQKDAIVIWKPPKYVQEDEAARRRQNRQTRVEDRKHGEVGLRTAISARYREKRERKTGHWDEDRQPADGKAEGLASRLARQVPGESDQCYAIQIAARQLQRPPEKVRQAIFKTT